MSITHITIRHQTLNSYMLRHSQLHLIHVDNWCSCFASLSPNLFTSRAAKWPPAAALPFPAASLGQGFPGGLHLGAPWSDQEFIDMALLAKRPFEVPPEVDDDAAKANFEVLSTPLDTPREGWPFSRPSCRI